MTAHPPAESHSPNMLLAYLLGLAGVVIFGVTLPVTRLALADFSPWFITFARALLGAGAALTFLVMTGRKLGHAENWRIFLAGLFLIFGFPAFMALAMQSVPASHGGVVLGFLPIATAAIAALIAGERHSLRFWLLCMLGAIIVTAYSLSRGEGNSRGASLGDLWLLLAGLCASSGYVISGKLARTMPGWEVICRALVLNLPLIAAGVWLSFEPAFLSPSNAGLIALTYLGFGSMFLGFFAWNSALAMGGIARIGQVQLLQTFVTLAASALILAEHIDAVTMLTALVVTALIFLTRRS
ncbi:MAG: DMT family transporter [Nitratireductor sp.]